MHKFKKYLWIFLLLSCTMILTVPYSVSCSEQKEQETIRRIVSKYPVHAEQTDTTSYNKSAIYTDNREADSNTSPTKKQPGVIVPKEAAFDTAADCILEIPDLNIRKYVYNGADRSSHLEQYELVTASDTMRFSYGGNYVICGHYSKLYGHALNRLKEAKIGMKLYIYTKECQYAYQIKQIYFTDMNNSEQYCVQTTMPQVTILSCARYHGQNNYIVIQAERI